MCCYTIQLNWNVILIDIFPTGWKFPGRESNSRFFGWNCQRFVYLPGQITGDTIYSDSLKHSSLLIKKANLMLFSNPHSLLYETLTRTVFIRECLTNANILFQIGKYRMVFLFFSLKAKNLWENYVKFVVLNCFSEQDVLKKGNHPRAIDYKFKMCRIYKKM